mgnify:FL=1
MSYILEHTTLGFCWWDLPALIVLILVIVVFAWKHHDMKKQEKDLEDQIAELYADDTAQMDSESETIENEDPPSAEKSADGGFFLVFHYF